MSQIKCPDPNCNGDDRHLLYVQKVYEYHTMASMPDEAGYCDLNNLEDTINDDEFEPYLMCKQCHKTFDLKGKEQRD